MNPLRGIALKLGAVLMFIIMMTLLKATSDTIPAGQAVFFRSLFALPVILVWMAWNGELASGPRTSNALGHVWRGVAGTAAMGLNFAALAFLPLPEVTAIGYAAPLLTVVLAAMLLGEEVRAFRIACVVLGLLGVLIVAAPRLTVTGEEASIREALGAILVLGGALCAALAQIFVRKMIHTERASTIVFWFTITATFLSLMTLPWGWAMPSLPQAVMLISAGLLGGVGQIFLTSAYRWADASLVAPFDYASMLLALLFGYVFFADIPTLTMLGGAGLVMLAGVLIILRERHLGLQRARQRKAMPPGL